MKLFYNCIFKSYQLQHTKLHLWKTNNINWKYCSKIYNFVLSLIIKGTELATKIKKGFYIIVKSAETPIQMESLVCFHFEIQSVFHETVLKVSF
jgi:hypothetical protein